MSIRHFVVAGALAAASAAQAQVIFSDNFNADSLGLNKTTFNGGWTVGNGTVDVIGAGPAGAVNATGYDFLPGNGNYIDLDGSTADAGIFSKSFSVSAGQRYSATFSLAGSQRPLGSVTDIVDVTFGTASSMYTLGSGVSFTAFTVTFTAASTGTAALTFSNRGSDYAGILLDNVTITAVPEPSTYALLLAGIGAVVFLARRRNQG